MKGASSNLRTYYPPVIEKGKFHLVYSEEDGITVCKIIEVEVDVHAHLWSDHDVLDQSDDKTVSVQWLYRCTHDSKKPPWESRWLPEANKKKLNQTIEDWSCLQIGPVVKLSNTKTADKGYVLKQFKKIFEETLSHFV